VEGIDDRHSLPRVDARDDESIGPNLSVYFESFANRIDPARHRESLEKQYGSRDRDDQER
jgi:hypothetical protein